MWIIMLVFTYRERAVGPKSGLPVQHWANNPWQQRCWPKVRHVCPTLSQQSMTKKNKKKKHVGQILASHCNIGPMIITVKMLAQIWACKTNTWPTALPYKTVGPNLGWSVQHWPNDHDSKIVGLNLVLSDQHLASRPWHQNYWPKVGPIRPTLGQQACQQSCWPMVRFISLTLGQHLCCHNIEFLLYLMLNRPVSPIPQCT